MSGNSFGTLFRVTTFGESHGPALGVVIDGVPAGLEIDMEFIASEMARRRPGQSKVTTSRQESDVPEILSGVLNGVATGAPLAMLIRNENQRSGDYDKLADTFRPGHADFSWEAKYGFRDVRGGGRSSGRETVSRVAAGAVAKLLLKKYGIAVRACACEIAGIKAEQYLWDTVEQNPLRAPDPDKVPVMLNAVDDARASGDSVGGIIYGEITGIPAGLGEPVFDKMDSLLAHALFSIGGIKGVEIGSGFEAARMRGSQNNDPILPGEKFASNHAGGILGGITNGDTVTFRAAVKPTPSIAMEQQTVSRNGEKISLSITGRHDPCIVPRAVPVAEAMAAIVTADLLLQSTGIPRFSAFRKADGNALKS